MRIGIVRLSALGDLVMCLPLIATLKKSFPNAEITWIIEDKFYPLFDKIDSIQFIPVSKIRSLSDWIHTKKMLKNERFDVLLCCQASMSANLLYPMIKAKRKIGYDKMRSKDFHNLFIHESHG